MSKKILLNSLVIPIGSVGSGVLESCEKFFTADEVTGLLQARSMLTKIRSCPRVPHEHIWEMLEPRIRIPLRVGSRIVFRGGNTEYKMRARLRTIAQEENADIVYWLFNPSARQKFTGGYWEGIVPEYLERSHEYFMTVLEEIIAEHPVIDFYNDDYYICEKPDYHDLGNWLREKGKKDIAIVKGSLHDIPNLADDFIIHLGNLPRDEVPMMWDFYNRESGLFVLGGNEFNITDPTPLELKLYSQAAYSYKIDDMLITNCGVCEHMWDTRRVFFSERHMGGKIIEEYAATLWDEPSTSESVWNEHRLADKNYKFLSINSLR